MRSDDEIAAELAAELDMPLSAVPEIKKTFVFACRRLTYAYRDFGNTLLRAIRPRRQHNG